MAMTSNECEDALGQWRSDCDQYVTSEADCKSLFDYWIAEGCEFGGSDQYAIFHNRVCKECLKEEEDNGNGAEATVDIQELWDDLIPLLNNWLTDIFDGLGDAIDSMIDEIASWISKLVANIKGVFDTIGKIISDIVSDIWKWFTGVLDEIKALYKRVEAWISGVLEAARDWVVQAYKDIGAWLGEIAIAVGDAIKKVYEYIGKKLQDALDWTTQALKDIWKGITDVYYWVGDMLKIAYDATLKPIGEWFKDLWGSFTDAIKRIGDWFADIDREVKAFVNGMNESLVMGMEDLIDGLGDIFWNTIEKVGTAVMNLPDEFQELVSDAMSTAIIAQLNVAEKTARKVLKTGVPNPQGA